MCRLSAYIGPDIALEQFLLRPSHNLIRQAQAPREMRYACFNADGYGFGWYDRKETPASYVNILPPWADVNLATLARCLHSRLWVAHVRSATLPYSSSYSNNQPFTDQQFLFLHNGFLEDFTTLRRTIREFVQPEVEASIRGTADSEYVFALVRHLLVDDPELSIEEALLASVRLLSEWAGDSKALLNILLSDGVRLYATRYACNDPCPSLYYTLDDEAFPNGQLLASEPLSDSEFWQPVPEQHLLILDPEAPPELIAV